MTKIVKISRSYGDI